MTSLQSGRDPSHPTIYMTVAVWGESFLDLFLDHVLPSYLAPGVIPEVPRRGYGAVFWLYTTSTWSETIRGHRAFQRLTDVVDTRIVAIDERTDISGHTSPYETMNACHLDFMAEAEKAQAAMVFFSPDAFWSDQALRFTLDEVEKGARAVLMAGMRAQKESVLAELAREPSDVADRGFSGARLVALLLRHPHRITESLEWGSPRFDIGWPSHVYWRVGNAGWVGRCFHLHTFYVHPRASARPEVAHDFDWMAKIGLRPEDVRIVDDTDQVCALELSPAERGINGREGRATLPAMADWVRRYAESDHRSYARRAILFRADDARGGAWLRARAVSAVWLRAVLLLAGLQARLGVELRTDGRWAWIDGRMPPGFDIVARWVRSIRRILFG